MGNSNVNQDQFGDRLHQDASIITEPIKAAGSALMKGIGDMGKGAGGALGSALGGGGAAGAAEGAGGLGELLPLLAL